MDTFDGKAVDWAVAYRGNADQGDVQVTHGCIGSMLDLSIPLEAREVVRYGHETWLPVLIDDTMDWNLKEEAQYGDKRFPPGVARLHLCRHGRSRPKNGRPTVS